MATCDRAMREAQHELVFWSEEDWQYSGTGWLKESFRIIEQHPEIFTVSLRGRNCNGHPLMDAPDSLKANGKFYLQVPNWRGGFGGMNFNPGLRRKSDYRRIGSYTKHTNPKKGNLGGELALSQLYTTLGYFIAALPGEYVQHLGEGRSRAVEPVEYREPRILIAVKAGRRLSYGAWESEKSPHFNPAAAYRMNGRDAYDTGENPIHVSGDNPRLAAVRDTWFKDALKHPAVTAKFFYGHSDVQPLEDEVNLNVPDDYGHLADKTRAICKWAVENDFDYAVFVDDDTLVDVDKLVSEIQGTSFDYAGHCHGNTATGGPGYILSRKAMEAILANWHPHWAEDCAVSKSLFYSGITPENLIGHKSGKSQHFFFSDGFDVELLTDDLVTAHAVNPTDLRAWWAHKSEGTPNLKGPSCQNK
jgi:hypothetical protein